MTAAVKKKAALPGIAAPATPDHNPPTTEVNHG